MVSSDPSHVYTHVTGLVCYIELNSFFLPVSKPVLDRDATFSPDHHPLSQSLSGSIRNQDTILEERTSLRAEPVSDMFDGREGIDSPGSVPLPPSAEGVWMGMGGGGNGEGGRSEEVRRRRRRTSSVRKMVMWVITEDNR